MDCSDCLDTLMYNNLVFQSIIKTQVQCKMMYVVVIVNIV